MSLGEIAVNVVKFVVDIIEMVFRITFPIGWDELGVIATVSAVVVALVANRKASEQLKSALEMQEQSKNVSLLDKRVELAEALQYGRSVSMLTLQVLFNDEIVKHYTAWQNHNTEETHAVNDLDIFLLYGADDSVRKAIEQYEADMSRPDCPRQVYDEYEAFCKDNVVWQKAGENNELTPYNHSEIKGRIAKAQNEAKQEKDLTLKLIEKFIADSIRSIGKKTKRKKGKD